MVWDWHVTGSTPVPEAFVLLDSSGVGEHPVHTIPKRNITGYAHHVRYKNEPWTDGCFSEFEHT
jgi:hypothetical protein